jgi:hypothetical protein
MTSVPLDVPTWAWLMFAGIVVASLILDLWVHRGDRGLSRKQAIVWCVAWISVALLFSLWVGIAFGRNAALEFVKAYAIEKSLSANVFAILGMRAGSLDQPFAPSRSPWRWAFTSAPTRNARLVR